ncbi:MAG: hypothetical protein GY881_01425 [Gammaproteobacteria bacterium]|jgi:glutamine synthetase type III|nr:hypothetical protein [Gammaproteobacteria bacterium]MCP4878973.1 hypothetical protein [Gammaproteobacteria bacterium]MDP6164890.1 hypothetical protein [Gammaproteobacteria bacterium]
MSDDNSIENLSEQLNDIVANLDHSNQTNEKQAAEQRALAVRRRLEELQEQRRLKKDIADFDYDLSG